MAMLRLDPSLPGMTPLGEGRALVLLDYSEDHHLFWVCAIDKTGEIWTYANPKIRVLANPSLGTENQ